MIVSAQHIMYWDTLYVEAFAQPAGNVHLFWRCTVEISAQTPTNLIRAFGRVPRSCKPNSRIVTLLQITWWQKASTFFKIRLIYPPIIRSCVVLTVERVTKYALNEKEGRKKERKKETNKQTNKQKEEILDAHKFYCFSWRCNIQKLQYDTK